MKIFLFVLLLISSRQIKAQTYVLIPDANFATYLQGLIPSAMSGNSLDISNPLVTTTTQTLDVSYLNISDLTGVQYFSSLTYLDCDGNLLTTLPALPNIIQTLNCSGNYYSSLPALPNSLKYLYCYDTRLVNLPALPNSLIYLDCSNGYSLSSLPPLPNSLQFLSTKNNSLIANYMANLPALPNSLQTLLCGNSHLTSIPVLGNSLTALYCDKNDLTSLPTLPSTLDTLVCCDNHLTSLPPLPSSLRYIYCYNNYLTNLPPLPNSLLNLLCYNNFLTSIPPLPSSLMSLSCYSNSLTSLPTLPSSLILLVCDKNFLTSLPALPNSLQDLSCGGNQITCFPTFPNSILPPTYSWQSHEWSYYISLSPNPFTCLPNHITAMPPSLLAYTLCSSACTAGIEEFNVNNYQISVYPNPTNKQFTIETNSTESKTMALFDLSGRLMFSQTVTDKTNIDVASLSEGVYNLTIKNGSSSVNRKLIIVK